MRCPVCETNTSVHWVRGFLIAFFLALLIGFVGGQLFHDWQYTKIFGQKIEQLEERNQELKKGFVPPEPGKKK